MFVCGTASQLSCSLTPPKLLWLRLPPEDRVIQDIEVAQPMPLRTLAYKPNSKALADTPETYPAGGLLQSDFSIYKLAPQRV